MASLAPVSAAEVIHLRNGDVIYADQISEDEKKITYEVGDNTFTIPKSLIKSVDKAPPARPDKSALSPAELPTYTPSTPAGGEGALLNQVVRNGEVDRGAINAIESRGNPAATAIAFYIAGRQEFQAGKYSEARRDFESALRNDPTNPAVLTFYAALLVKTGNAQDALSHAERAASLAPDSADALAVLGYAQFAADRPKDAILSWKRSLALRPDASIQQLLARAERETVAESDFSERETGHFVLHYEGKQSSEALRAQILSTLESHYSELAGEFGIEPRASIRVILYTNQAFFDVTQAPSWTGALNDGKLRIPIQGLETVSPDLRRILKHELAHSFVNQISMGRCPHWLNEGIAQMLEPRSVATRGLRLSQLFKLDREIPLNTLERGFLSFTGAEAELAYDESLASAEYIRAQYGMSDIIRLLQKIGQGDSTEAAMRSTIHCDYRQLQSEIAEALVRQFGS